MNYVRINTCRVVITSVCRVCYIYRRYVTSPLGNLPVHMSRQQGYRNYPHCVVMLSFSLIGIPVDVLCFGVTHIPQQPLGKV